DRFQRLACFEAVKRKKSVTPEEVSRFSSLPLADVLRHLGALKNEGKVVERAGQFTPRIALDSDR
ncbi:MAG: hypothetical protein AAGG79_06520, partial [Pseudomonadota bacterium]